MTSASWGVPPTARLWTCRRSPIAARMAPPGARGGASSACTRRRSGRKSGRCAGRGHARRAGEERLAHDGRRTAPGRGLPRRRPTGSGGARGGKTVTFSLVARDDDGATLGAATASKYLAVGATVPVVAAGVGALVTQAYTNVSYRETGVRLLREGQSAARTVELLVEA